MSAKLLLALRDRGWELAVVTRLDDVGLPRESAFAGVPVYRLPFYQALKERDFEAIRRLTREVRHLKRVFGPSLVHISSLGPSILFHVETDDAHPPPLIVTVHELKYSQAVRADTVLGRILRTARWISCVSEALLSELLHGLPELGNRSSVIHNGIEEPVLPPRPLPFDPACVLCIGRIANSKGFDLALAAFASVVRSHPDARLIIAGDGPARMELARSVAALGLAGRVTFVGWVPPECVNSALNEATVVVIPSRRENCSMVALEAGMMARPVVATRVGGLPEIIVDQVTGLLVPPESPDAIAKSISSLLDDPEWAGEMGRAARTRSLEAFSWQSCLDAYDRLLSQWSRG